jgi:hypothetical protein
MEDLSLFVLRMVSCVDCFHRVRKEVATCKIFRVGSAASVLEGRTSYSVRVAGAVNNPVPQNSGFQQVGLNSLSDGGNLFCLELAELYVWNIPHF